MKHNIQSGDILIAEPFMKDPNFKRTVVLLTEHTEEGAFGLVLNRPSVFSVNEMLHNFPKFKAQMFLGGPVGIDRLNYLHSYGDIIPNSIHVVDNLYWNGDYDALKKGIVSKEIVPHNIKFFIGYAGWDAEQITEEMEDNSWILSRGYRPIFRNPEVMWKDILMKMGGQYKMVANYPEDPNLN